MKKKLSSDLTPLYKNLWVFFAIGLVVILFLTDIPPSGKWIYSIFWLIGIFIFWILYKDLRTVVIDARFMYVSDGRTTEIIPFSEIKDVQQEKFELRNPVVVVELRNKTKLGSEIKFIPYLVLRLPFMRHPVVEKLKRIAKIEIK